jgi:hypothetical protein
VAGRATAKRRGEGDLTPLVSNIPARKFSVKKRKAKPLTLGNLFRLLMRQAEAETKKATKQKSKELPKDSAPLVYLQANGRLRGLLQLAKKGSREAAKYLLSLLTNNVECFLNLCSNNLKLAREIRFPGEPWPLLHTQLEVNPAGYFNDPEKSLAANAWRCPSRTQP